MEKKKHRAGRHSKFDEKTFFKKVKEYLQLRQDEEIGVRNGRGTVITKLRVKLPTIEGFAAFLGVTKMTLYNWAEVYPEAEEGLEIIKQEQFQRLIDEGLAGNYNPMITRLILAVNHGMIEETRFDGEVKHTFDDEQINRIAKRLLARKGDNSDTPSKEKSH